MNDQNNQEEEEYEEEEIEVYEEVEVDEEAELDDEANIKNKTENKNNENISKGETAPLSNNSKEIQIPKLTNNENLDSINKQNINNIINNNKNEDKDNELTLETNNDILNTEVTDKGLFLEDKIKFENNDGKNNIINESNNFNMININNNDFNFDFSNNFNLGKNNGNKYLDLDYKIVSGRESLDITNDFKLPNFEKNEPNLLQNKISIENNENNNHRELNYNNENNNYREKNYNNEYNNINRELNQNNNNNIERELNYDIENDNNINRELNYKLENNNNTNRELYSNMENNHRQPLTHRSKIRRNNKKPLNFNNFNTNYSNNGNYDYNNNYNSNYPNMSNTTRNINNQESYTRDNDDYNYETNNNYINNINSNSNQNRSIKNSLNNMISYDNDYQNNININQNINPDNIIISRNDNNYNLDNIIRYNDKQNFENKNFNDENNIYNPIINNKSQMFENKIENNNNEIKNVNEIKMNEIDMNNNLNNNLEINNENAGFDDKKNNNDEDEKYKKKLQMKKTKEELQYENTILEICGNNEIINLLDSRKWEEKKKGFLKLNQFLTENSTGKTIIENNFNSIFMYIVTKLNNFKETNFNLLKEGILCLQVLCNYYKKKNLSLDKKYLDKILFGLNEKIADTKLKEVYLQLLSTLIDLYSSKTVYDLLFEILLITNKMIVLKEYSIYIRDNIKKQNSINDMDLKNVIEFSVKIANHTNPQIRSISIEIICLLYQFIGPDLKQLISGIKESTLKLIEKELEKINFNKEGNENKKIKDLLNANNKTKKNKNTTNSTINLNDTTNIKNVNNNTNLNNKRIDISKEITPKLLKDINRGKWLEKKEAIEYLNSLIDKANNKILKNGLQELFDLIKEKLNDGNQNLVKMILQLLSHLILALEGQIKIYYKNLMYPLLMKLTDKSKQIRDECLTCIENWIKMQNFEIFAVYLPQMLISNENFDLRNEILNLLSKNKDLIKTEYPKTFFKELTKAFLICLQDKNSSIRNSTEELIKEYSNFIPREKYVTELKDIKRSISDSLYNILNRIFPKNDEEITESFELKDINKKETKDKLIKDKENKEKQNKEKENKEKDNKEKESKENKDYEKKENEKKDAIDNEENENDITNNDTLLLHQQLLPNKKHKKKINIRINKKSEGTRSTEKMNFKINKKQNSFIQELKNKNALNNTMFNSTILGKTHEKDKKNTKNRGKKNKLLSCDKVPSNLKMMKKNEKSKFSTLNINTENNTTRNLNKTMNYNDTTTSHNDIKKPGKKARNRSTIADKKMNNKTINNYYTKKDVKSLTAEKTLKFKKKINPKILQNSNINAIKELPIKKINPKKFVNNNESKNKNQIFLPNYKIKKGLKEKRLENDKKNNFCFEVLNFHYMPKINELLKTIFTTEFITRLFSNDLKLINLSLTQLKTLIDESIKNGNDENYNKLIDNLDLLLKVIAVRVYSNQTASLIKSFFIFADTLINSYKIKKYEFNDTEINILLNIFADKLTNNNLILKETACNLIWFLNDQIDSGKTFTMLIHLLEYKNAKLKSEIIDIIIKLYNNSTFDINIIFKVLKNIIRAYFEADFNSKKKVLSLLQDIYGTIGEEFWKYTKFLSSEEMDELYKNIEQENENEQKDTSKEYDIDDLNSSNFGDDESDNIESGHNNYKIINKENKNENNEIIKFKDSNYDYDNDNEKNNNINKNGNMEKHNKKHIFKRSITDNSKKEKKQKKDSEIANINLNNYNTNIITSNITDINNIIDNNTNNKNDDSKCILEKDLKEALNMLVNPEEDMVEAIINIHYITFRNYNQNKKILNSNADNIINCFIEIINKLFSNKPLRIKIIKYYIVVLCKLCNIKEFIINISIDTQKNLIILVLSNLLLENLNTLGDNDEGMVIWKSLNSIISHIIEFCDVTKNILIIIDLEQKFRKEKPKLAEYSARCLVIITQNLKNSQKIITLKKIFNNIYSILGDFTKETNDLQLKEKTDQTIIITLRNLINELVKIKIDNILNEYNEWIKENNIKEEKYIINWINESINKIKKIKDEGEEDNKNENENIIIGTKKKSLDDIKKKWKELQEKNNNK